MFDNDTQKAEGKNINQAGRDIVYGVNQTEIKEIVQDLLNAVYDTRVQLVVSEYMHKNMQQFSKNLLAMIDVKALSEKILKNPDLAFVIDKSIKIVGEKGDKLDLNVLLKLLENRINSNDNSLIDIVTEQSIDKMDKITNEHIALLTLIHIIQNIKFSENDFSELEKIYMKLTPLTKASFKISDSNKKYLASLGLIEINILRGNNTKDKFYETYKYINSDLAKDDFIKKYFENLNDTDMIKNYTAYENNHLYQIHLTTVGEMIALANLKKIYPDIDITIWIK